MKHALAILSLSILAGGSSAQAIPQGVHEVERLSDGRTLLTDGGSLNGTIPGIVFEVDAAGGLVHSWQARTLWTHSAQPIVEGGVLVSDTNNERVLEIARDGTITWNSQDHTPLSDGSNFDYPNDADPLANGNILVCDRDHHRVLEITHTGLVVWQFGVTDVPGSDGTHLNGPHNPDRLANGNTIVADSNNDRILEISPAGAIVWQFQPTGVNALDWPRDADRQPNGDTVIADSRNDRIVVANAAGAIVATITGLAMPYDVDKLASGNYLVGGNSMAREVTPAGATVWQYPPAALPSVVPTFVLNPTSGVNLSVTLHVPAGASAANKRPAVIMIPGGSGTGAGFAQQCGNLARLGFVAVRFDPDGRGQSTNGGTYTIEDYDGFLQQDGLRQVALSVAARPEVDATRVALYSNSYGVTMASGMLARYPSDPAIGFFMDWEGPASRNETSSTFGGHVPVPPTNNVFWAEREAITFMPDAGVPYTRLQSEIDHVAPSHPENFHAIDLANAALASAYGGTGSSALARVNSELDNPAGQTWSLGSQPEWIPEEIGSGVYLNHRVQLELTRALDRPGFAVSGTLAPGGSATFAIDGDASLAGRVWATAISLGSGPSPLFLGGWLALDYDPLLTATLRAGILNSSGNASVTHPIIDDPALHGLQLYSQALVLFFDDPLSYWPTTPLAISLL